MLSQEQFEAFEHLLPSEISISFKTIFKENATFHELPKGEILASEHLNNNQLYFILKGSCVRHIITPIGNERAIMFHTESFLPVVGNLFVSSSDSDVTFEIKTNENTTLIGLNTKYAYEWIGKDSAYASLVFHTHIGYFSIINQIQNHLIGLSSQEFLQWLLKKHGFIFQRFSSKDIASFMGVTPVWLSNLKRALLEK